SSVGRKEDKLGQRASDTSDVILEEVKLTRANLVGEEGQGFKVAMKTFDRSRPWIAAGATGIMRRALDECRRYALERKAFGQPIAQFQAIQFMLAEMAMKYEATRLLMLKASWNIGEGQLDATESHYAKASVARAGQREQRAPDPPAAVHPAAHGRRGGQHRRNHVHHGVPAGDRQPRRRRRVIARPPEDRRLAERERARQPGEEFAGAVGMHA